MMGSMGKWESQVSPEALVLGGAPSAPPLECGLGSARETPTGVSACPSGLVRAVLQRARP